LAIPGRRTNGDGERLSERTPIANIPPAIGYYPSVVQALSR
jgi:hypothetical protein